ncbi:SAV_2336 N-terminal domain-related protein [Streptomyces naphthomycinicus]|uniref:SAV_2336 N-terminal domain-related protein n=1 Tax=Streptomyces naphthomycinicus TaxID=2872625 RepID=UPI001CEC9BCC|nr:SAV_2336 N-terminal domain-related protein [Streptomyces sp. TML10]
MTVPAGGGERLAEVLRVLTACGRELDADQVLDVLWLARRLPADACAPLLREPAPAPAGPAPAPGPGPEPSVPRHPAPEPDDPDLPDLTAPSLYAAARQTPVPEVRRLAPAVPEPRRAMPVRVPEDKALGDELELGRALRPLRRRLDSRHRTEIDEERTAAQLAETNLPDVVERPVRERWLNLALLVDDGLSMLLWHRLGAELRTLLERLGAFATTRVLGLDTRSAREPCLRARPFRPGSGHLPLSTVNDPSGRTLVLVVSDGMGAAWRSGALHRLLAEWAARGPVAVLQTLPPEMWEASGIAAERWQATTRRIGGANAAWEVRDPVLPPEVSPFEGVPVPVLEPAPSSLGPWARLLASPGITVELPLLVRPDPYGSVTGARDLTSAQHFRDAASPEAYRLAAHLAAVSPLSVPVMRLVQSAVPWPATTSQLAEVFLGGLVRPHPAPVPGPLPAKHRVFDFAEESKTVLLDSVPQAELLRTSRRIGRHLEELAGNSPDFPAWLAHPDGSAQLPGTHQPFTSVERRLLARFGVSFDRVPGLHRAEPDRAAEPTDDWEPLTGADPVRLGPYTLRDRRRGRRTVLYRGIDARGTEAVLRTPRPDLPAANAQLIAVEAEVLGRLQAQYAPALLATGPDDSPPWLAMAPVRDQDTADGQPPRLSDVFARSLEDGTAPFDLVRGLLLSWHLANALALCHAGGLVPADFGMDSVYVLRRTIVLGDLSDYTVDGRYLGAGPAPTVADSMRALGAMLQLISSKAGVELPNLPDGMHLWQGDGWEQLRRLVLRCLDDDPARRPTASEVADALAKYIAMARLRYDARSGPPAPPVTGRPPAAVPLTPPARPDAAPPADRLPRPRFRPARAEFQRRLAGLRAALAHSRRVTLVGAFHHSGRATATMALGSLLAAARAEPVLALDGAATEGALGPFLPSGRNRAVPRDLAALPLGPSYDEVRALTTRLPSGLEVIAHRSGRFRPNSVHAQEYLRVLTHTAPYYSFVLTDWAPTVLDRTADVVLDHTDRLVVCCGTADWFLDAAARMLDRIREGGRRRLADRAVVLTTRTDGAAGRGLPEGVHERLGVLAGQVVQVPFDTGLQSARWELKDLRPATVHAYLRLAELVVRPL